MGSNSLRSNCRRCSQYRRYAYIEQENIESSGLRSMQRKYPLFFLIVLSIWVLLGSYRPVHCVREDYAYCDCDAKVWREYNSTNYGTTAITYLGNMTDYIGYASLEEHIGFFKFDFSDSDFNVSVESNQDIQYEGFEFWLYADYYLGVEHFYTLAYTTNQTWEETAITWLDYPSFTETSEDVLVDDDSQYFKWDMQEISADVQNAIENDQNFTVVIYYDGYEGKGANFRMREYGGLSYDPRILIKYDIVTPEEPIWEREISLTQFPLALADALHITPFAGGVFASMIVLMMFMLPVGIWAKNIVPSIFVGFLAICLCVSFGWLDLWVLLVMSIMIALLFGAKMKEWATGVGT